MKSNKKKGRERDNSPRQNPLKALMMDINDQLQSYLDALKTASDGRAN